ncbi:hypothetical protein D0Z07_2228 [Hyphodiscus hymeniophilus]|uniref:PLC-like phosphodiesterase n=1 Tax=Hyphodiscus hymeniophilus TaxID=353542 RepID=A0A9P6VMX6_9HELO|nr:hypothetical protein D0Z07_2228 [Hyphodiscus hymeniophilus]
MPSKGIQCYSYIAVPNCTIEFSVPGSNLIKSQLREFSNDHVEVDKAHIKSPFSFTGTFCFKVSEDGRQVAEESIDINVLAGDLEGGSMKTMENQLSVVTPDVIVAYGFYDAGPGVEGLPSSNQCYVTVTPNYSNWMHDVAAPGSPQSEKPFIRFFLPAAHDIGMNSMASASAVIKSPALVEAMKGISPIFAAVAGMMTHEAAMHIAPNIVRSLAMTQKDTLPTILALGARYFEFRPAYLHSTIRKDKPIPDVLYFSHSAIPGMAYAEFLHGCVQFLIEHPDEIIVTQLRWDGVPNECARPSDQDLSEYLSTAIAPSNGGILAGDLNDMLTLTISALRTQRKRLLIFSNADSFSTYTDAGNATLVPGPLISEFDNLASNPAAARGKPFTNLQCQATATNIKDVVIYSVLAANADNSCMLATKAVCDNQTLPWIMANGGALTEGLVVCMNDFFDGGTADVGVELSRRRLA